MRHIEQQRAAGLLHVDGELAGEPVAHVILGTQDVGDPREDLRLMCVHPQQLGQREVGQRRIAGQLDQAFVADLLFQPVALGLGARVAPDERGAQDLAVFVEHDAAVHLAGEADGLDLVAAIFAAASTAAMASRAARHQSSGSCSAQPMCSERMGACSADAEKSTWPSAIHQHGPRATGAYVDSKKHSNLQFCGLQEKVYLLRGEARKRIAGDRPHCTAVVLLSSTFFALLRRRRASKCGQDSMRERYAVTRQGAGTIETMAHRAKTATAGRDFAAAGAVCGVAAGPVRLRAGAGRDEQ